MAYQILIDIPVAWDCDDIQKLLTEIKAKLVKDERDIKKLKRGQMYISDYQNAEVRINQLSDPK